MATALKKVKEVVLIEGLKKRFRHYDKGVVVSIGNDAAVVSSGEDKYLLYTADMLIEGTHFKKSQGYKNIGYKAMAVSVSDIAAMGGVPKYALVSVGLPAKGVDRAVSGLYRGISLCASRYGIDVIGGDTNKSQKLVIDVFMTGEVEKERLVLRSTAKTGDFIFVSGPLGGSFKGRHLSFVPRLKEARYLVENYHVTSMMDLSDGLGMDLNRISSASKVGALIFENKIPRSTGVKNTASALFDGEDFELLFTMPEKEAMRLLAGVSGKKNPHKFFPIGRITDTFNGVRMVSLGGIIKKISSGGFSHF